MKLNKIISKVAKGRIKTKKIFKKESRATIVLNQPVYLKDKARNYKETFEEERRQLFFT